MPKIKAEVVNIEKYNRQFFSSYNFTLEVKSDYQVELISKNCVVQINCYRYEPGIQVYFINSKSDKIHSFGKVYESKGRPTLPKIQYSFKSIMEKEIYHKFALMEKYMKDELKGDFSKIERSNNSDDKNSIL